MACGKSNLQRDYIPSLEVFWDQWLVQRKGSLGSNDSRILGVPSKPHKTVKQRDVQNLLHWFKIWVIPTQFWITQTIDLLILNLPNGVWGARRRDRWLPRGSNLREGGRPAFSARWAMALWIIPPEVTRELPFAIAELGGGFKDFLFSSYYLGKISILTNIFQMGWNHQPEKMRLLILPETFTSISV